MLGRAPAAIGIVLLVLVACGDSAEDTADTPAPTAAAGQTTAAATAPAATPDEDTDAEMSPENCPELVAAISGAANATAAAMTGNPSTAFPTENMRALAERIPEIADDLRTIADAYEAFFTRLEELGVDLTDPSSLAALDPAAMEEVSAAGAALDEGAVGEANARIQAFFERECS